MNGVTRRLMSPVRFPRRIRRLVPSPLRTWMLRPDVALMLRWREGELTPAEEARFNERMMCDDQFRHNALLLMRVLSMRLDLGRRYAADASALLSETGRALPVPREQKAAAYANVRARLGLPPRSFEQFEEDLASYEIMSEAERSAGIAPAIPSAEEQAREYRETRSRVEWDAQKRRFKRVLVAGAAALTMFVVYAVVSTRRENQRYVQEAVQHRATTAWLDHPTIHETQPNTFDQVTLEGGTRAILDPSTRLSVSGSRASLDGRATIEVRAGAPLLNVRTAASSLLLTPGKYEIEAAIGGAPTILTVVSGLAHVHANEVTGPGAAVRSGQRATITGSSISLVR